MIGYPSGQDGAILPTQDMGFVLQVYRSFLSVFQIYCPRSFFACLWDETKELGQYPAILTSHLVNNPYFINGDRAEQPGFKCMNARLGRLQNWRAHRILFHFRLMTRISHKMLQTCNLWFRSSDVQYVPLGKYYCLEFAIFFYSI